MNKQQYRNERRGILEKIVETRALANNARGGQRAVYGHVEYAALEMLVALRAEFYRGQMGAMKAAQSKALADVQSLIKRLGAAA